MDLGVDGYNAVTVTKGAGDGLLVVGDAMVLDDKDSYKANLF